VRGATGNGRLRKTDKIPIRINNSAEMEMDDMPHEAGYAHCPVLTVPHHYGHKPFSDIIFV
jgi:hypothetical protein